ncbi:MAG TPA: NUDIX hydrolase [Bacteroidales bacterium]|nr:NUDIX hydrolase [Bacteroidales bacterium]
MSFTYPFPRPALTVDIVIFRLTDHVPEVLLIQRANEPYKGYWALPGGFVDKDESLEHAAARELEEETGLKNILLTQMHAFGNPGRDPRGHTVSVVYVGYLPKGAVAVAGDDAAKAAWHIPEKLPDMAFDHEAIIEMASGIFLV